MLIASKPQAEPQWLTVMGAQVLFSPISRGMFRRARKAALEKLGKPAEDSDAPVTDQLEELGTVLSEALLIEGAREWRDVAMMDDDGEFQPLAFSADNFAMLLADPITFEAFDQAYVWPFVTREREKNGSAASSNTTSGTATAEQTIAGSAAAATTDGAKSARTPSTRSKPKRAKKPSTS